MEKVQFKLQFLVWRFKNRYLNLKDYRLAEQLRSINLLLHGTPQHRFRSLAEWIDCELKKINNQFHSSEKFPKVKENTRKLPFDQYMNS